MTHLEIGQTIPVFELPNEKEELINNEKISGTKTVIFFYPKDDTPGCTREACSIRDNYKKITNLGYEIYGVSPDKVKKHNKFIDKFEFQFSLLADPEKKMINDFGMWGTKKFMGKEVQGVYRTTLILDEKNTIVSIITKVKTKDHGEQILNAIAELTGA